MGIKTEMIDRNQVFKKYPWLSFDNLFRYIVMGDDLDAALSSALLMHQFPHLQIIGVYHQYHKIAVDTCYHDQLKENLPQTLWIDLDIIHPGCYSIGHHILTMNENHKLPGLETCCNPNEMKGIDTSQFGRKYPLGTVHFLMWLLNIPMPESRFSRELLWMADSAFINGQSHKYKENAGNWITKYLDMEFLKNDFLKDIDTIEFEQKVQLLQYEMKSRGFLRGNGQIESRHLKLKGFQCQPRDLKQDMIRLMEFVSQITGWSFHPYQVKLNHLKLIKGKRQSMKVKEMKHQFGDMANFLNKEKAFSYVFPFQHLINYTVFPKIKN